MLEEQVLVFRSYALFPNYSLTGIFKPSLANTSENWHTNQYVSLSKGLYLLLFTLCYVSGRDGTPWHERPHCPCTGHYRVATHNPCMGPQSCPSAWCSRPGTLAWGCCLAPWLLDCHRISPLLLGRICQLPAVCHTSPGVAQYRGQCSPFSKGLYLTYD